MLCTARGAGDSLLPSGFDFGGFMFRRPVNKRRSAGKFKRQVSRTKSLNSRMAPNRGGWRL